MNAYTCAAESPVLPTILTLVSDNGICGVFAFGLSTVPAERPESESRAGDEPTVLEKRFRDHVELVHALAGSGSRTSFALRYVARPGRIKGSVGSVETWLLTRVSGRGPREVEDEAKRLARQVAGLLTTLFPDHEFRPAGTLVELNAAWRPLGEDRPPFVASLSRATRRVRFASPVARAGLAGVAGDDEGMSGTGLAIASLEPRLSTLARVLRALLARSSDSFLQASFRPVHLPVESEEFLVSAIARLQEIERAAERRDGAGLIQRQVGNTIIRNQYNIVS